MTGANGDRPVLPPGWDWATLGDLCAPVETVNPARDLSKRNQIKYVDLSAVVDKKIVNPQEIAPSDAPSRARQRIATGDTLFSCVRVYLENVALVPPDLDGEVASTAFAVLRPANEIDPGYLHWLVRRPQFIRDMISKQRGNSPPAVLEEDVKAAKVPLAPKNAQPAVALRIDELFGEVEAGEQELEKAREGLETYRRAVLKAAVTGELTKEWRERNTPSETGADLLARILKQRRATWERAEFTKLNEKGQKPRGEGWKSRYDEFESANPDDLPHLPVGWVWATLDQLCEIVGGITVDAKRRGDELVEVPYLRVANVQRGELDLGNVKTLRAPREKIRQLRLLPNDILINEGGDRDKVGRGWVWSGEIDPCIHQNHVFRVRPVVPDLDGRFISSYANELGRGYFLAGAKQTTNLASISLRKVASLPVPLPPIGEINVIVAAILEANADIEMIESTHSSAEMQIANLRQSVLSAAFAGKLVPQDPADEPASQLLDRIRAARAAAPAARRTRSRFVAEVERLRSRR